MTSMDTSSVPLMMDMEEEEEDNHKSRGLEAGLENDFAYNNNVAGASKHVRLGEIDNNEMISIFSDDNDCQDSWEKFMDCWRFNCQLQPWLVESSFLLLVSRNLSR